MIGNSKKVMVRRSLCALLIVGLMTTGTATVFAETGYMDEDVGVADIDDGDTVDLEIGVEDDSGIKMDVEEDPGIETDIGVEDDSGIKMDIEEDPGFETDADDLDAENQVDQDAGADFLFVEVGVEVQFSGNAPDVVKLGLSGDLGEVELDEVSVSAEGIASWEVEDVQAGTWVLSAIADGYEPVSYRFVAGDLSQMLIRISMVEVGSHADAEVESGWACSAVASDAAPSMLVFMGLLLGSMWIQRRKNR